MKLTTYIIDDEPHAVELLTRYIEASRALKLLGTTLDPREGLRILQGPEPPQLAFIDINMPELSGITLAAHCQQGTSAVLTTSYKEYGPQAFELNVVDYLLKPFSFERFLKAVEKAEKSISENMIAKNEDFIFINGEKRNTRVRLRLADLLYIEGAGDYVFIHTREKKTLIYQKMHDLISKLPAKRFMQVHKSYVINLAHLTALETGILRMDSGATIPIGRAFAPALIQLINLHSLPLGK